jgi:hypothetical protein
MNIKESYYIYKYEQTKELIEEQKVKKRKKKITKASCSKSQ